MIKYTSLSNRTPSNSPSLESQSLIEPSSKPDAINEPSGEKRTENTLQSHSIGPSISLPLAASHTRIVLSKDPDTICVPSGENDTEYTYP